MIRRARKFLDGYVLLMFAVVGLAAALPAHGRGAILIGGIAKAAIVLLFFLYGARISLQAMRDAIAHRRLQAAVVLMTFGLYPVLGLVMSTALHANLPLPILTGIFYLCILPSTVQSSITFTSIARGNVPAAVCAASISNVLGVFVTPLLAGWLLGAGGASFSLQSLRDIVLLLLVPFAVGQVSHRWVTPFVARHHRIVAYLDRGSILLIIYVAFSAGMVGNVWSRLNLADLIVLLVVLLVLLALSMIIAHQVGRRWLKLPRADRIVLLFCGSKKSLASGLPMATLLFPGAQLGIVLLPLMLFHQIELIVSATLARHLAAASEGSDLRPHQL